MRSALTAILALSWSCQLSINAVAAPGDVRFRAMDANLTVSGTALRTTLDILLDIESAAAITANGWSLSAEIVPQPGSQGGAVFDVAPIMDNLPNLPAATQDAFTDFDREQQGMSYGTTGEAPLEMIAFSPYVRPAADPPVEDAFGNITVPSGVGLVSLPLRIDPGTQGDFLMRLQPIPFVTGVSFATGSDPADIELHPNGEYQSGRIRVTSSPFSACDVNQDRVCDVADIGLLSDRILTGQTGDPQLDLNADGSVDSSDREFWVEDLMNTYFGDANLDLQFNSSDMVGVFVAGEYEDNLSANSRWGTGDWDGNAEFETTDLIVAFQKGGYERGMRPAMLAVPEPVLPGMWVWISVLFFSQKRRLGR